MTQADLLVDVVEVRVLARYFLELTFDDGAVKVLDLEDWLTGPDFGWLREDYEGFRAVVIDAEAGSIRFPNGASFAPSRLYLAAKLAIPA
jgi:hypothetical protein